MAATIIAHLRNRSPDALGQNASINDMARTQQALDTLGAGRTQGEKRSILGCVDRATIAPGKVEVCLDQHRLAELLNLEPQFVDADALRFETPFQFRKRGVESKLIIGDQQTKHPDASLLRSIAKAHQYYGAIKLGASFEEIAASEKLSKRRILQVIDLAFLAPDIVRSVVRGDQPVGLTAKWLGQNPLPSDWDAQRRIVAALGIASTKA